MESDCVIPMLQNYIMFTAYLSYCMQTLRKLLHGKHALREDIKQQIQAKVYFFIFAQQFNDDENESAEELENRRKDTKSELRGEQNLLEIASGGHPRPMNDSLAILETDRHRVKPNIHHGLSWGCTTYTARVYSLRMNIFALTHHRMHICA